MAKDDTYTVKLTEHDLYTLIIALGDREEKLDKKIDAMYHTETKDLHERVLECRTLLDSVYFTRTRMMAVNKDIN